MLVTVIIVNFNSSTDCLEAVESLERSQLPEGWNRKVIVVENGSKDQDKEWQALQALAKYPDVELVKNSQNLGFTGGYNQGLKRGLELKSDYFLLLNPDTKVKENFLVELLKVKTDLASPKIYFYPGFEFHKDRYKKEELGRVIWYAGGFVDWANVVAGNTGVDEVDVGQYDGLPGHVTIPTTYATGCCLLASKKVVQKIGLLDNRLFFSWEDTDYSLRARASGFEAVLVPGSVVWHKNANTSGGAGSPLQDFYQTRNRLIFAFRYAPVKTRLLLLWQLFKTADRNRLKAILFALLPFKP